VHLAIIKQHATSTWHKTNPGKYGVCFIMFIDVGIASFGFVLLLFDDWQCKLTFAKVFFAKPLQQPFCQTFLPPKFLLYGKCMYIAQHECGLYAYVGLLSILCSIQMSALKHFSKAV